jgi:putative ABC transport system permease protein
MSWWRRFWRRLAVLFSDGHAENELAREMRAHLTLLEDDFRRRGLSADDARLAARRAFGGVEQAKERQRDARSFVWLADAQRDMRHAARLLRRDPLFTATAVLSLAIGIGANTTIFTVGNALLFRAPAGVADPEALVDIGTRTPGGGFGNSSYPNYLDVRHRATTFDGVYASGLFPRAMSLSGARDSPATERVFATPVTGNYFAVLGTTPAAGRLFDGDAVDRPGTDPVIVLSHRFWTRRFNRDPSLIGRTILLNRMSFTVIGVAAEGFQGPGVRAGDLWLPMTMSSAASSLANRTAALFLVSGRLRRGVSIQQAAAELDAVGKALELEYPAENRGRSFLVEPLSPVPGARLPITIFLVLLLTIVTLVLGIACANVAAVLLARAAARRTEIAVRLAMGAGRARLIRQLLAETLMLFVLGGLAGVAMARVLTSVLVALLPSLPFPVNISLALDGRALVFTAGMVFVSSLLSGLVPALQASKADVVSALKDDAQAPARLRLRHAFVIAQVAVSILLVVVAGLFVRALQAAGSGNPGFDPRGVELASLDLSLAGYTSTTGPGFASDLADRVRALPDVQSASIALVLPGGFETQRRSLTVPGVEPPNGERSFGVDWNVIEPRYFATMRIPIVSGRDFAAADREGTQAVAIVGEGTARQFWPGEEAVGKFMVQTTVGPAGQVTGRPLQVVGVARDVKASTLIDGLSRSIVYVPLRQHYMSTLTIVARTTRGQRAADEIQSLVAAMNPDLPIIASQTLEDATALGLVPQRVLVSVAGGLGVVGALLAAIGIYGVTAYAVARRRREIGIRMALGARRVDVVRMILQRGIRLTVIGCAIGLLLAAGASQALVVFLFGVAPLDAAVFGGAAAFFAVIGLTACYLPAHRATTVDPLVALRRE